LAGAEVGPVGQDGGSTGLGRGASLLRHLQSLLKELSTTVVGEQQTTLVGLGKSPTDQHDKRLKQTT